jgi:FkbM family methyltransferase
MLKEKLFKYIGRTLRVINVLGLYKGLLYSIEAKILRNKTADSILRIILHGGKIIEKHGKKVIEMYGEKIIEIGNDVYMWRGKIFKVPGQLTADFISIILLEIIMDRIYVLESSYDVIVDIGGFLGETAWWFITEGYAKRVIVFEPVYYDLCKSNVGDVAEVRPQAVHWSKGVLVFKVSGGRSRIAHSGEEMAETVTLSELLSSLTGRVAVKMDCEGCEESILHTPCDILRRSEEYIVETHPWVSMESIVRYMESCGFSVSLRKQDIYHFRRHRLTSR